MISTIDRLAKRAYHRAKRARRNRFNRTVRARLAGTTAPEYTTDYVSDHIELWSSVLDHLMGRPGVRMLEVGSFEGRSAVWFLEHVLTDPTAELICVDLFTAPGSSARFDHNVACARSDGRVVKRCGDSGEVLTTLEPGSFDAAYVDGSHRAAPALLDLHQAWRLLRPGGVLIADDYLWEPHRPVHERPELAIDLFCDAIGDRAEVLHHGYQVILAKRVP